MHDKIIALWNDFLIHDNTKMLLFILIATNDMIKYVSMYPEVWFIDCTYGEYFYNFLSIADIISCWYFLPATNRQGEKLFVMGERSASGDTLPGNLTIIPSWQKWVFHSIYKYVFPICILYNLCKKSTCPHWQGSSEYSREDHFSQSTVMPCTFHGIWMAFNQSIVKTDGDNDFGILYGTTSLFIKCHEPIVIYKCLHTNLYVTLNQETLTVDSS
jgi:hypothetical protein